MYNPDKNPTQGFLKHNWSERHWREKNIILT